MDRRTEKTRSTWVRITQDQGTQNRLRDFVPLLNFANAQLQVGNWTDALWQAMGQEKFCTVTYLTKDGPAKKRMWAGDVMSNVSGEINLGSVFAAENQEIVTRGIEQAITHIHNDLPKVAKANPSLEAATELQCKVKQVLDCMLAKSYLVHRQRRGADETSWVNRLQARDLTFRLTGQTENYSELPWQISHFEEAQEITEMIKTSFEVSDTRRAIIASTGFASFDDEGEDAERTLSWMLLKLEDVVFQRERSILRKCQWCQHYFFHETLKRRIFCSDLCRYDSYNKRQRGKGN